MSASREQSVEDPELEQDEEEKAKAAGTDAADKPATQKPPANEDAESKLYGDADDSWGALKHLLKKGQTDAAMPTDALLVSADMGAKGPVGDKGAKGPGGDQLAVGDKAAGDQPAALRPEAVAFYDFLDKRIEQVDRSAVRGVLLTNASNFLKQAYDQLPPDQKKELESLMNDPQKLRSMAESYLTQELGKLLEEQIKNGKIKPEDKERLLTSLSKGELPPELLKAVLEKEKESGKPGPVTEAVYSTMLNSAQEGAQRAIRENARQGRPAPADCPAEVVQGKVDLKLDPKKIPSEADLDKLQKLEKWNETARGPVNPQLDKLQEMLIARADKLDGSRVFSEVQRAAADVIKEQYNAGKLSPADKERLDKAKEAGKLDEEVKKLAGEKVKAALSAQLEKQVSNNEISRAQADARKKDLDKGIADPSCIASLLKQERETRDNGTFTRAALSVLQKSMENKVAETSADFQRDKKQLPAGKPVESGKDKPELGLTPGKIPTAEELAKFSEKLEKVEKWLAECDKVKNVQITKLQENLNGLLPAIDRPQLKANLTAETKADLEKRFNAGELPPDQKLALDEAFRKGKKEFDEKLEELAAAKVKELLKAEIDTQIRIGTFSEGDRKKLEELVDKDALPDELVRSMLAKELRANTFGPVTRALYKSAVSSMEEQAVNNFTALSRSGLQVPPDCPIPMRLNKFGTPEPADSIMASMIAGTYKYPSGIQTRDIPSDGDLQSLVRLARWNQESSRSILNYAEEFQYKNLQEMVLKMNRPEWMPKEGEDRQQWMMRVGPMVDTTMQVKAAAQALALVEKMSGGSRVNFDREQLRRDFPGKLEFDKDGRITKMELDLPKDLNPSLENRQKLERIQAWLEKNEGPAKKAMEELAKAAQDKGRLLLWADLPQKDGKFQGQEYNLERHRFSIENVKVDGKEKIRVRNNIDYHQSEWYNYQDFGAKKVGSEQCKDIDPQLREQIEKDYKAGKLPPEKMKELQDAEKAGPERYKEVLDKAAMVSFRDYDPTDMVCVIKDGKLQMVMAKDLETWRAQQELKQNFEKGVSIAFDVGMTISAVVGVGVALNAARVAGAAANVAIKQAAMAVFKQELKHGLKNLVLGGSGFVLNNSWAQTNEYGKMANMARHVAFVVDGAVGLAGMTKGGLQWAGLMKPAALTAEARNIERVSKVLHNWNAGKDASLAMRGLFGTIRTIDAATKYTMLAGEAYLVLSMSGQAWKQGSDMLSTEKNPAISQAARILYGMRSNESDASRFLKNSAATMAGSDSVKGQLLTDINKEINDAAKLAPAEKQAKVNDLIKRYDQAKTKEERTLLAAGILSLVGKDGQLPENIGTRKVATQVYHPPGDTGRDRGTTTRGRGYYTTEMRDKPVTSKELLDELGKNLNTGDSAVKLVAAQALILNGKLQMPEYATACRQILADDKAPKDVKMQAVMGLGYCMEAATQQTNSLQTGQDRAAAIAGSYGCSREQLEKTLLDLASKDKDADVRAMAGSMLQAMNSDNAQDKANRLAEIQATWKAIQSDTDVKRLEKDLQRTDLTPDKRKELEKDLERSKLERQVALESMALIRDPKFAQERIIEAQKREDERKQLGVKILSTSNDIKSIEERLKDQQLKPEDKETLEKQLAEKKAELAKSNDRLKEIDRQAQAPLPADKLPAVPESFAKENDKRWLRDLNAPAPSDNEARQEWAAKRLEAIKMLEMTGSTAGGEASKEKLNAALVDLANMNNGLAAVEALRMLVPSRVNDLNAEQKQLVVQAMKDIMTRQHKPPQDASAEDLARYREAALAKTELVKLLPQALKSNLCSDADKNELKKETADLLDMSRTNTMSSAMYPDLRAAAIRTLGEMGPLSDATMNLIRDRMKFDLSGENGEPNASVRLAAFETLKKLNDPQLLKLVQENLTNERDPALARKFADMEFGSLRPDNPENTKRIYQLEVQYWSSVLERAEKRYSPKQIDDFFKANYPHVHPERFLQIRNDAEAKLKSKLDEIDNSFYWFGYFRSARNDDRTAAINELRHPYLNGQRDDWNKLVADAKQPGERGDKARSCLMYLAAVDTTNHGGRQMDAARELHKLIKEGCPNREALFGQMIEAWRQRDIPHDVRKEFLDCIDDMTKDKTPDGKDKEPIISKQYAGRLLHEALQLEIQRTNNQTVNDWQADQRFQAILGLLKRVDYPLHKAQLEALAGTDNEGQKLKIHENTRKLAREHLAALNDTAPRNPGDLVAQAKILQDTVADRAKLLRGMEEEYRKAHPPDGKPDSRSDDERLADQAKINGKDAQSTRRAMIQACAGDPIRKLDDPRIAHLQTLMKDPDKGVAMTAAWFLVNAGNPENTNDAALLASLKSQPWYKEALAKLQEIARTSPNGASQSDQLWINDASRYMNMLKAWDVAATAQPPQDNSKLTGEQKIFADSKAMLDGSKPSATLEEKKNAIDNIVRIGALAQAKGDVETQKRAEEVLRQVAASGDPALARAAYDAYQQVVADHKPSSDEVMGNGDRVITWENGKTTKVESGADFRKITYPDGKWMRLSLDENGQVKGYTSSEFTGEKKAGQDFHAGSINMNPDGSVTFDEANGMRRIRRASGESWTFMKGAMDAKAAGDELAAVLKGSQASADDKIAAIEKSLSNISFTGGGIKAADDPRLALLKEALNDSDSRVKAAAARALLDRGNTALDAQTRRTARETYLREAFSSNGSPSDAIARLKESLDLLGPISDANDPRVARVAELLASSDKDARVEAAAAILQGSADKYLNSAFSADQRKKALETLDTESGTLIERGIVGNSAVAVELLNRVLASKDSNLTRSALAMHIAEKGAGWEKASQLFNKYLGDEPFTETLQDGTRRETRKSGTGVAILDWKNGELTKAVASEGVKLADLLVKDLAKTGQAAESRFAIAKAILDGKAVSDAGNDHKQAAYRELSKLVSEGANSSDIRLNAALRLADKDSKDVPATAAESARVFLHEYLSNELTQLRQREAGDAANKPKDADWARLDSIMEKLGQGKNEYGRLYIESKRLELKQDHKSLADVYQQLAALSKARGSESGERLFARKAADARETQQFKIKIVSSTQLLPTRLPRKLKVEPLLNKQKRSLKKLLQILLQKQETIADYWQTLIRKWLVITAQIITGIKQTIIRIKHRIFLIG